MYRFEKFVRLLNFVFTKTIDERAAFSKNYDLSYRRIRYNNCYSLKEIMDLFVLAHNNFKEEYDNLDKFDLGDDLEFEFNKSNHKEENHRYLTVFIKNPTFANIESGYLFMQEVNGEIKCLFTDADYDAPNVDDMIVNLDEDKVREYLDLFEKYQSLLKFYQRYNQSILFRGNSCSLYLRIYSKNDNVLDDMERMWFYISIEPEFNGGNSLIINYDLVNNTITRSSVEINNRNYKLNEKEFLNLLNSIYISKDYINKENSFDGLLELKENLEKENAKQKSYSHN